MIRSQSAAPARVVYAGGPWDGREETLEAPGGIPTILPVDDPLGVYVRAELLPDRRWRMSRRGVRSERSERRRRSSRLPRLPKGRPGADPKGVGISTGWSLTLDRWCVRAPLSSPCR